MDHGEIFHVPKVTSTGGPWRPRNDVRWLATAKQDRAAWETEASKLTQHLVDCARRTCAHEAVRVGDRNYDPVYGACSMDIGASLLTARAKSYIVSYLCREDAGFGVRLRSVDAATRGFFHYRGPDMTLCTENSYFHYSVDNLVTALLPRFQSKLQEFGLEVKTMASKHPQWLGVESEAHFITLSWETRLAWLVADTKVLRRELEDEEVRMAQRTMMMEMSGC